MARLSGVLRTSFELSSRSNSSRTSTIDGLFLGSVWRQFSASEAAAWASFLEYWPPILVSIILNIRLLSLRRGFPQSTRVSSTLPTFSWSNARLPERSSSKTTPKLYTSLFGVKWPVAVSQTNHKMYYFLYKNIFVLYRVKKRCICQCGQISNVLNFGWS